MAKHNLSYHTTLSSYFQSKPLYLDEPTQKKPNVRKLMEQPWQQTKGEMWDEVTKTLSDILFLCARTTFCDIWQLLDDYSVLSFNSESEVLKYYTFIAKHAQTLSKHDGQLIALLQHEGFLQAKEQIELIQYKYKNAWLRTNQLRIDFSIKNDKNTISLETISSWKFEISRAVCFAVKAQIAFHLIRLGEVGIIDIIKSCPFDQRISIRKLGTLALFSSEDGKYLIIAYENGEADIIELEWNCLGLVKQYFKVTIKYKLPVFEDPFFYWDLYEIVYQDWNGAIILMNIISGEMECLFSFNNLDSEWELRQALKLGDEIVFACSTESSTQVLHFADRKTHQIFKVDNADTISMCACGLTIVAISFSNREIRLFEITQILNEFSYFKIMEIPTKIIYDGKGLIIVTDLGTYYYWNFKENINSEIIVKSQINMVQYRQIAFADNQTILSINQTESSVLKMSNGAEHNSYSVIALFSSSLHDYAVVNKEEEIILLNLNEKSEIKLINIKKSFKKFSIDGSENLLCVCNNGTGFILNLVSGLHISFKNIPETLAISTVVGDTSNGFWIADHIGDIYNIDKNGLVKRVWVSNFVKSHVQEIICTEKYLCWRGWVNENTNAEESRPETLIFFEINNGKQLIHIGKRIFRKSDGFIETMAYNNHQDSLMLVLSNSKRYTRGICFGTIEDFITYKEYHYPISYVKSYVQAASYSDPCNFFLLTLDGSIFSINNKKVMHKTVLSPYLPFSKMSNSIRSDEKICCSDTESNIYYCSIENK